MGIKFRCPNGHKLNVKSFLAGKKGICPHCGISVRIPETAAQANEPGEVEDAIETGGAATAVLAKPMAGTVSIASTTTVPVAAALPVTPVTTPTVTPITTATVVAMPGMPATAAPLVATPVMPTAPVMATPVAAMPVASAPLTAAPMMPINAPVVAAPLAPSPYAVMPVAPMDPIAEAPNAVWYVRPPSGGQFGPARGDVMQKWLGEGRVSADSLVWRDGWQDWKNAAIVFPQLTPAAGSSLGAAVGGGLVSTEKPSLAKTTRAKKRSNGMAIAAVITLGLIAVVLLVVFIFVVSGMNQA